MRAQAILIAGPTASGKSALALEIARRLGGVIVNADSMQVYRDLRIITARPTPRKRRRFRIAFLAISTPARITPSVAGSTDFDADARDLDAPDATPVVAGGTGMYFKAALYGLSDIPPCRTTCARECARPRRQEPAAASRRTRRARPRNRFSPARDGPAAHLARAGSF